MMIDHPLRTKRIAAGLSVEALAERVRVSKSTISRIETWNADPSLSLMKLLCENLDGLTAGDFMAEAPDGRTDGSGS